MTHPHRDLIIALLDDPTLEVEELAEGTVMTNAEYAIAQMLRFPHRTYCLREKPKPDVVTECRILGVYKSILWNSETNTVDRANLRLTFTADGVLKNAKVI